ncbi:MAG TPA: hypothetical protein VGM87_12600 [Roseomonas sp.]|jgi:hypothetical protein
MATDSDLAAVTAGAVIALRAVTDALVARDYGLQVAIEERLRAAIAELATAAGPGRAAAVPRGLLAALQTRNRGAPVEE